MVKQYLLASMPFSGAFLNLRKLYCAYDTLQIFIQVKYS